MGLDMYLKASISLSEYDAQLLKDQVDRDNMRKSLDAVKDIPCIPAAFREQKYFMLETTVVQWRKANQIHKWFVDNVQDGRDDCQTTYVSRDTLRNLIDVCKQVLENKDLAQSLLPTEGGFFFGSTEYDDYYFRDLEDTIEKVSPLLEPEYDNCFLSYSSSW